MIGAEISLEEVHDVVTVLTNKDIKAASRQLTPGEVRYLVDLYYQAQEYRIGMAAQVRSGSEGGEPNAALLHFFGEIQKMEKQIQGALEAYTSEHPVGRWLKGVYGIGPVISAGLLAHIDIEKAPTAGHIWSFAGMNPEAKWLKGQRRPWNARLKVLCWKAGQSFMKFSNRDECIYGRLYKERKAYEQTRNGRGEYAEQALKILEAKKIGKDTEAYKWYSAGMLPPAHIDARARRWAVKIFLSHLHHVWYEHHYGEQPPLPFAFTVLGHDISHYIEP